MKSIIKGKNEKRDLAALNKPRFPGPRSENTTTLGMLDCNALYTLYIHLINEIKIIKNKQSFGIHKCKI